MLTQALRDLERDGLVDRQVFPTTPPSVEYRLTPLGESLLEPLGALIAWAEAHVAGIVAARAGFARQHTARSAGL
jgi:DNA-binding HxlR family transcriptional regulator